MSFPCGICGETSPPRTAGTMVPIEQRKVTYNTPFVKGGQVVKVKTSVGVETVEERLACKQCAASPPSPEIVGEKTVNQPPCIIPEKGFRQREES